MLSFGGSVFSRIIWVAFRPKGRAKCIALAPSWSAKTPLQECKWQAQCLFIDKEKPSHERLRSCSKDGAKNSRGFVRT